MILKAYYILTSHVKGINPTARDFLIALEISFVVEPITCFLLERIFPCLVKKADNNFIFL